jgi:hypothetical protein
MHALADGLEDFNIDGSRAAIITVVLKLFVAANSSSAL